jgi:hypothetical protein
MLLEQMCINNWCISFRYDSKIEQMAKAIEAVSKGVPVAGAAKQSHVRRTALYYMKL